MGPILRFLLGFFNDLLFRINYTIYLFYDTYWTNYFLIWLETCKDFLRTPINASLPRDDPEIRDRQIKKNKLCGLIECVLWSKELFMNLFMTFPLFLAIIFNYPEDDRSIRSRKEMGRIVENLEIRNNFLDISDYNAYQLNTAFDIMKKIGPNEAIIIKDMIYKSKVTCTDVDKLVDVIDECYFQDCRALNMTQSFDIYAIYHPVFDKCKRKRLRLIAITVDYKPTNVSFTFGPRDPDWITVRNNYINWSKSVSSFMIGLLGSNIYCTIVLNSMINNLSPKHPIYIMLKQYLAGNCHTTVGGISLFTKASCYGVCSVTCSEKCLNTENIFDQQSDNIKIPLKMVHEKYCEFILNYPSMLTYQKTDNIYFEQKESLKLLHCIIEELVSKIMNHYYVFRDDFMRDTELHNFYRGISIYFVHLSYTKKDMINLLTGIIFLASVRNSQQHANSSFFSDVYDYGLIQTNIGLFLENIIANDGLETSKSYNFSSVSDFYRKYSETVFQSVPITYFRLNNNNLYCDKKVNRYFKEMSRKVSTLIKKTPRNNYTEYLFRLQKSNPN
jgi:hypothetical protein